MCGTSPITCRQAFSILRVKGPGYPVRFSCTFLQHSLSPLVHLKWIASIHQYLVLPYDNPSLSCKDGRYSCKEGINAHFKEYSGPTDEMVFSTQPEFSGPSSVSVLFFLQIPSCRYTLCCSIAHTGGVSGRQYTLCCSTAHTVLAIYRASAHY